MNKITPLRFLSGGLLQYYWRIEGQLDKLLLHLYIRCKVPKKVSLFNNFIIFIELVIILTMKILITCLFFVILNPAFIPAAHSSGYEKGTTQTSATSDIKIHDFTVYATWSSVAILHNVEIENISDTAYENIKVRIFYSSFDRPGNVVSQESGIIPVTVPPHSKKRYLKAGIPFGGASQAMNAVEIQVLGAEIAN